MTGVTPGCGTGAGRCLGLGGSPAAHGLRRRPPETWAAPPAQQGPHRQKWQQPGGRQAPRGPAPCGQPGVTGHQLMDASAGAPTALLRPRQEPLVPRAASSLQVSCPGGRLAAAVRWPGAPLRVRVPARLCPSLSRPCLCVLLPRLPFAPVLPWAPWGPSQASLVRVPPPPGWLRLNVTGV